MNTPMSVEDLINVLLQYPRDTHIYIEDENGSTFDVLRVKEITSYGSYILTLRFNSEGLDF